MSKPAIDLKVLAEAKGFTPGELSQWGVRNGQGGVVIPYKTREGADHIRYHIRVAIEGKNAFRWSSGDAELLPYGLQRPVPYTKGFVWIVEGESDCWTLWRAGIPALGLPGAKAVKPLRAAHLDGAKSVAVVREPGEAGEQFPNLVAQRLYDDGFGGKVYAVPLPAKDPRELYADDAERFHDLLSDAFRHRVYIPPPPTYTVGTTSLSIAELFDLPIEDVEWLVDGLIPKGGVALLSAKPKAGKTVFARNMALAVARGNRFMGRRCEAGVVLWVALEERKEHVINAFKAMGIQRQDPIRFHFGTAPLGAHAWLERECEVHKPALIVLDTWHKLTLLENVNDYGAVNRANEPLMRLSRERGVAQVWVHHNNKSVAGNGDEVLGSSALFAAADVLLTMTRGNDGIRAVRSIQRVGSDMEETVVQMDDNGLISASGSRYVAQVEAVKPKVLAALGDALTRPELLEGVEGRRTIVLGALNDLLADSSVVKAGGTGKRGDPVRYHRNPLYETPGLIEKGGSQVPGSFREPPEPQTENPKGGSQQSGTTWEPTEPREPTEPQNDEEADLLMLYADERI